MFECVRICFSLFLTWKIFMLNTTNIPTLRANGLMKTKFNSTTSGGLDNLKGNFRAAPKFIQKMNFIMANDLLFIPQHFTLTQKRIIAYAIGLITKEHRDMCPDEFLKTKFIIHAKYFKEAFQIDNEKSGNVYKDIKDAVDLFMSEVGAFKLSQHDKSHCKFIWVQQCNYVEDEGKIELYFSSLITDFLINFTGSKKYYVNYSLFVSHALRSQYAIRLYELLQTRQDTNCVFMSFDQFKEVLDINKTWAPYQVREKVLARAQKELNTKLDLGFTYEITKNPSCDGGYQVVFKAERNNQDIMNILNFEDGKKYLPPSKKTT